MSAELYMAVAGVLVAFLLVVHRVRQRRQRRLAEIRAVGDISGAEVAQAIGELAEEVHNNAVAHGFYDPPAEDGTRVALIHSEASEMLEAFRDGNPQSEKIPGFSHAEEEAADIIIRVLDMAHSKGWDIGRAILAKHAYNVGRPHKHGRKAF